jgi:hypothetical protein
MELSLFTGRLGVGKILVETFPNLPSIMPEGEHLVKDTQSYKFSYRTSLKSLTPLFKIFNHPPYL